MLKNIWRNENKVNPGQTSHDLADHHNHHSADQDNPVPNKQLSADFLLQRSKSCGEGRGSAPADELTRRLPKPDAAVEDDRNMEPWKKGFKCDLLCLFLQVFCVGNVVPPGNEEVAIGEVISRTVSMEKFECGSWASSAICRGSDENGDSKHLYFDLPLELIRSSVTDDANSTVTAAFVFDKHRKGILKKNGTKSDEYSPRHVRFSTSYPDSPTLCISPRLLKAREDFTAFLEAQSK
ncbi:uncharacterized protein LOC121267552 [Juglans microcarpa x Juglans regia]|uniref:uncharacterized protein LOC121267552 n=1 Tax=Juglans microcarpa x Juglans regia TaxID=2249226 RepID=UPI001B7E9C09|nr:uncharacterized protein LOC121267552 [Juglans microcarpa x Juglans regia]